MSSTSIKPDATTFKAQLAAGKPQLVYTTLVSDLETPVSAMLKLKDDRSPGLQPAVRPDRRTQRHHRRRPHNHRHPRLLS